MKIKHLSAIAKTKFLGLFEVTYYNKYNHEKKWIVASRKSEAQLERILKKEIPVRSDAVVLVPYHETLKKLVLIKQYRVPVNDYVYELPAGLLEADEESLLCAERELREETGLTLKAVINTQTRYGAYASAGMTDESLDIIYCTCEGEVSNAYQEEDEDIETILLDVEEVRELLNKPLKMDIKALMVCQQFVLVGEKLWIK